MITKLLSSLEKVFPQQEINAEEFTCGTALKGEIFSFQLACFSDLDNLTKVKVQINSSLKENIKLYCVTDVPVRLPAYKESDEYYISKKVGLYPDLLKEYTEDFHIIGGQWRTLWIEVSVPKNAKTAAEDIEIILTDDKDNTLESRVFNLEILNAELPEQELLCTNWFHCDCLSEYYGVKPLSEKHWQIIDNYMKNYRRYGMNMILTPMFTPALDTEIGGERPTVQLVKIHKDKNTYSFDFAMLDRFMDMSEKNGIEHFELSHLFTQWGAKATPKIVTDTGERIFGWDVCATSDEYREFITCFLTELKTHLKNNNRLDRCYFHISDEPSDENIVSYGEAVALVSHMLEDCNLIDALHEYKFYKKGLVRTPIPSNDFMEEFIENEVSPLWTYYCCGQGYSNVSNRFIAMPSARNRVLGLQLFKYNVTGFLHWGYNFWFSHLSKQLIDPYFVTDAMDAFPSGDPFIVYPREDGTPSPSLRQIVFNEAIQDLRALKLLEKYMGHDETVKWLENFVGQTITFKSYPQGSEFILSMRTEINKKIKEYTK